LLKVPSSLALGTARDGAPTAPLGSLCHCLTTLIVGEICLMHFFTDLVLISDSGIKATAA